MADLAASFQRLVGRQPTENEIKSLYRVRDALELDDNDALWMILMALQHYDTLYTKIPYMIEESARNALLDVRETAQMTAKAATEETKRDLARAVSVVAEQVATDTARKGMWKWAATCVTVTALVLAGTAWFAYQQGVTSNAIGQPKSTKEESSLVAWATTQEGRTAYRLAQVESIRDLASCNRPGWYAEKGGCYVRPSPEGKSYGWRIP